MKRWEAIRELVFKRTFAAVYGQDFTAEAYEVAIKCMQAWDSLREHIDTYEPFHDDHTYYIPISKEIVDQFIREGEPHERIFS